MTRGHDNKAGTSLLLVGATGVVGMQVLKQALAHPGVSRVLALSRRPLRPHAKLENRVMDFTQLPMGAPWWAVDAVICTLGTTLRQAGSSQNFVQVDLDWTLEVARAARAAGANRFALNSSLGADARSRGLYLRTKGEAEDAIAKLGYPSFTVVRPSLIDAHRRESRPGEAFGLMLARLLRPVLPRQYRAVKPERIAKALLEGVLRGEPGLHVVESRQLQP